MNEQSKLKRGKQLFGNSMMKGTPKDVPPEVIHSQYGCINCLWSGVECIRGSMYKERIDGRSKECAAYTYYD